MNLVPKRLALFVVLLLSGHSGARASGLAPSVTGTSGTNYANSPMFLTGTSSNSADPYYDQYPLNSVPVGKTTVLPIAISGTAPMAYTATSNSPSLVPMIKTGYPVMNIHVTYSGTTTTTGTAPELTTLHAFTGGSDGGSPYAGLTTGSDGNYYGTTETSGSGYGTVYQLTASGSFNTIYSFTGLDDGANPYGGLATGTDGNLYGTTETDGSSGYGTVFRITTSGSLSTLYSFGGGSNGGNPFGSLVTGTDGNLYGTAKVGGAGGGTVFEITESGSLTTLHPFTGGSDGGAPEAALVVAGTNGFYGTTVNGGSGAGTVFQITTSGSFSTLYTFAGGTDGGAPYGNVIKGSDGNLYGTTELDGSSGFGTVYRLTMSGSLTTLHAFSGGSDGGNSFAGPVQAGNGLLYGTTATDGTSGYGTIYQLTTSGSLTTLYSFTGGSDGGNPYAGLLAASGGNFYGTTRSGTSGYGTVFEINVPTTTTKGAFSGTMSFALLRDMAPITTGYIAGFAQAGYYNGCDFFRITNLAGEGEPSAFIAQGGDPTNTGTGNPGFSYDNELKPPLIFTGEGQLAMANAGVDTTNYKGSNGAQFFITQSATRSLDFGYTIFGQLIKGFDIMQDVMAVPLQSDGSSPAAPVVMDSVTVSEDNTDAILLVNAAGYFPNGATVKVNATNPGGAKAVVLSGTSYSPGLSITLATPVTDTVNDPPIIDPVADVNAPLHQSVTLPIKAQDLEFDYLLTSAKDLAGISAKITVNNNQATVSPTNGAPLGSVDVGLDVYQPYTEVLRQDPYDRTSVEVGLGSGKLTPLPEMFVAAAGGALTASTSPANATAFGSFLSANPKESAADFTASINWGDGTAISGTSTVSVVQSAALPTEYDISVPTGHTYVKSGIYPLNVTVTDTDGAMLELKNTAVISPGPIYGFGRTFAAPKGVFNGVVATFIDRSPRVSPGDYSATINWGDGSVQVGNGIVRGANGSFQIYGMHKYAAGTTYPVDVTINSLSDTSESGYAWSTATLSGVPAHLPPFAQAHITGQIGNPGFDGDYLSEEVSLVNSGNKASGPVSLQFYLSPTSETQPISSAAIPLAVGGRGTYNTPSIPPNSAIQGSVSEITLPSDAVTRGRFIIMQVITSDPIGNHMYYPRAFADPYPLLE